MGWSNSSREGIGEIGVGWGSGGKTKPQPKSQDEVLADARRFLQQQGKSGEKLSQALFLNPSRAAREYVAGLSNKDRLLLEQAITAEEAPK